MKLFLRRIISLIFIGIAILESIKALNYIYFKPDAANVMWHSFYNQKSNVDMVFIGSSHVFCDIDTYIADEITNLNTFDLSTSGQSIEESYYSLLEADTKYDIKTVCLEIVHSLNAGADKDTRTNSWKSTDYMHWGIPKILLLLHMNDTEHLLDALFPFIRFRYYLNDYDYIQENIKNRQSFDFNNYIYKEGPYELNLNTKGFMKTRDSMYREKTINELVPSSKMPPDKEMRISNKNKKYLKKCIEYCKKNNIQIILFISPIYEGSLIETGNYDSYINSIRSITDEYDLFIYDFNIIKKDILALDTTDFYDEGHLNSQGAEKFTTVFMNILKQDSNDFNKFFYNSWSEKFNEEYAHIYK